MLGHRLPCPTSQPVNNLRAMPTVSNAMNNMLKKRLESVLKNDPASVRKRQTEMFDEKAGDAAVAIVLCGAGPLGQRTLGCLRSIGIEPLAWVDNKATLWKKSVAGLGVLSPEEAVRKFAPSATFVVTVFNPSALMKQLSSLGCARVVPYTLLYWKYPDALIPYGGVQEANDITAQASDIRQLYELWADEQSRREFVAQLEWRQSLDPKCLPQPSPACETYFPTDLVKVTDKEVFVDCGAFDGDSVRNFLERVNYSFEKVIPLEPDPGNCQKLRNAVCKLPDEVSRKISIHNVAVGAVRGRVRFAADGTAGSGISEKGTIETDCLPLDEILGGDFPTYIKMDIEGAEPEALMGARRLLKQNSAVWAICLYHKGQHLWELPLFIASLSDGYQFYLRRYAEDCWELVLYAIPKGRCLC